MSTMITGEAKKSFKAIVVKELPEKGILNNLYFVLNGDEGDNKYDEYIWVKDPDTLQYMWEKVGYSYVDLTPYYTKEEVDGKLSPITAHITNYDNPHLVTKDLVGLGNVDNTSDLDKPLSNNDKAALDLKIGSISIGPAINGLELSLYGAKENTTIGGQLFSTSLIGTIEIPVVSNSYSGLFPASKYNILDAIPGINSSISRIEQRVYGDMGTSVITLDNLDSSALNTAITQGYSLIRISDGSTSKTVTIINEGDGTNFTQYKYEGGQLYVRYSLTGDWIKIGPITYAGIVRNDLILYGRDRTGKTYSLSTSLVPVLGFDAESCGFLDVSDYNRLKNRSLILPENGITLTRTTVELGSKGWVNYNDSSSTVESIYISSATTSRAGVMTSDLVSMLDKSISSIVPTPSSDRITLKLKLNNGDTSDMPLGLVNTTNAGLMSPIDKSKLDGIESLASSDITALFS